MCWLIWLAIAVALLVVELMTTELVSIWFSISALITGIVVGIFPQLHWAWQLMIFALLAIVLLFATRPFVKQFLRSRKSQETNLGLIIHHQGVVEEEIDNALSQGTVKINGLVWTARSESGEKIPCGEFVVVARIDGNKLYVNRQKQEEK